MISPASVTTWPLRSSAFANSLGSRPYACARTDIWAPISSAVTSSFSARAMPSRTRSDLMARIAWSRESSRSRASSHPWDSSTCSSVSPARSARSLACEIRCSVSSSTRESGRSTVTVSIIACSARSRMTPSASRSFISTRRSRRSSRSCASVSNSEAVFANSSSASGSLRCFTSFRSTWMLTSVPPSSPNRSGSTSVTFRMSPGFLPISSSSSFEPNSPEPTK